MTQLASQVLAQGAGTSDVVRIMWRLSKVSFTQPSLELPVGNSRQCCSQTFRNLHANKQTKDVYVWVFVRFSRGFGLDVWRRCLCLVSNKNWGVQQHKALLDFFPTSLWPPYVSDLPFHTYLIQISWVAFSKTDSMHVFYFIYLFFPLLGKWTCYNTVLRRRTKRYRWFLQEMVRSIVNIDKLIDRTVFFFFMRFVADFLDLIRLKSWFWRMFKSRYFNRVSGETNYFNPTSD